MANRNDEVLISGLQPTGPIHIGNYLGAVRNFARLQHEFPGRFYIFIADYHSLTENFEPQEKHAQICLLAAELLAAGLDPKKTTLYVQSELPEVTELAWILNTLTPMAFLERMTQYKDKAGRQRENVNVGLFDYPVLQAADILIAKATLVPVGVDQVQHVELTRDIARFFNHRFGETFGEPRPVLTETPKVMSLSDPTKKMSKSVPESFISCADDPETIRAKMRRAVTDTGPAKKGAEKSPGVKNLFSLLAEFGEAEDLGRMERAFRDGSIRYVDLKDLAAKRLADHFAEFRKKRAVFIKDSEKVMRIFDKGAKKIRVVAKKTMLEVRQKIGLCV
jgi:tryptophanyl-tRNA synthetase